MSLCIQLNAPHCTGRKLRTEGVKWLAQGHTTEAGQESEQPPPTPHTPTLTPNPVLARHHDGSFSKECSCCVWGWAQGERPLGRKGRERTPKHQKIGQKAKKRKEMGKYPDQAERGWDGMVGC